MEVPHEFARASRLVPELVLLQLLICFAISLARADPFVVACVIGLYAVREMDRRALELYLLLVGVGAALDVLYLLIHEPSPPVLLGASHARRRNIHSHRGEVSSLRAPPSQARSLVSCSSLR